MAQPQVFLGDCDSLQSGKGIRVEHHLYTAAISGVDQELYEAADLDGASRIQKMRYVTLPQHQGNHRDHDNLCGGWDHE